MWRESGKPGPGRGEGLPEAWTPWGKSLGPKHAPRLGQSLGKPPGGAMRLLRGAQQPSGLLSPGRPESPLLTGWVAFSSPAPGK